MGTLVDIATFRSLRKNPLANKVAAVIVAKRHKRDWPGTLRPKSKASDVRVVVANKHPVVQQQIKKSRSSNMSRRLGSYLRPMYIKDAPNFRPTFGMIGTSENFDGTYRR